MSIGRGYEPEDITEAGEDVTSTFINGPPGEGRWPLLTASVKNPWIKAIGTAIIAAVLLA